MKERVLYKVLTEEWLKDGKKLFERKSAFFKQIGFNTKKEAVALAREILRKRKERAERKIEFPTFAERLHKWRTDRFSFFVNYNVRTKRNELDLEFTDKKKIEFYRDDRKEKETYGGRYRKFTMMSYIYHLTLPKSWARARIEMFDGIPSMVKDQRTIDGVTVYKALWITFGKSNKGSMVYKVIEGYIGKFECYYYHGYNIRQTIEGVLRKNNINTSIKLSLNDEITPKVYRKITGACVAGVDRWLREHGITDKKMKVKDLLPLLEKTHAYGLKRFKNAINLTEQI